VSTKRFFTRAGFLAATIGITGVLSAGLASAHVTANVYGDPLTKGGDDGAIFFRVPNEEATAGTVKVEVDFKPDYGIGSARTTSIPGWTSQVTTSTLPAPVKTASGTEITEAVTKVTWTAQPGTTIAAGATSFQEFEVAAGPLPSNVDQLVLPAVQTYDDGTVVNWNEVTPPGGAEPEHPAPTVTLAAATDDTDSSATPDNSAAAPSASDDTARWLGGAGLVVGVLGLGVGVGATVRARRTRTDTTD
jgi:uncharacterized protein YcnI